jgi:hypothetical protein
MLGFSIRKRTDTHKLSNIFVNSLIEVVENGFQDVIEMIKDDAIFVSDPVIPHNAKQQFLLILIVGNIDFLRESLDSYDLEEIELEIIQKFANIYGKTETEFSKLIVKTTEYIAHYNFPSKNILYGMSKAIFQKFNLSEHQESYFKSQNVPNPLFIKRLDEVLINFIWDWDVFLKKYKL